MSHLKRKACHKNSWSKGVAFKTDEFYFLISTAQSADGRIKDRSSFL